MFETTKNRKIPDIKNIKVWNRYNTLYTLVTGIRKKGEKIVL